MTERSIVEAAERLRRHGEPHLVATVVCVNGVAYRHPGARMLLTRFRWVAGSVSGGCLEGDISEKGWLRTRDGNPVLVTYDTTTNDNDDDIRSAFGLGCDGTVEVLLERAGVAGRIDALEFAARCQRAHKRGAVTTVFHSTDPSIRVGARLAITSYEILVESYPAAGGDDSLRSPIEPQIGTSLLFQLTNDSEVGTTCRIELGAERELRAIGHRSVYPAGNPGAIAVGNPLALHGIAIYEQGGACPPPVYR